MDFDELKKNLKTKGWLRNSPGEFADALLAGATLRRAERGEGLCHMADPASTLFCLAEGVAGVFIEAGPGLTSLAFIAHPGWWCGAVALANDTPRRASVQARTPVTFLSVPRSHVEALARDMPDVWRHVAAGCAHHYDNLAMLLATHLHEIPEVRILLTLRRLHRFNDGATDFRVNQSELAEIAGLSRKSANRAVRRIAESGIIQTGYGRLQILDPGRIEAALSRADLPVRAAADGVPHPSMTDLTVRADP